MTDNVTRVSMSQPDFNPETALAMKQTRSGMLWTDPSSGKAVVFRSPLLEVVYPPQPAPGKSQALSMSLRVHVSDKNRAVGTRDSERFEQLGSTAQHKALNFLLDNPKACTRFCKKVYPDASAFDEECKHSKFWYPSKKDGEPGSFYMRFMPSVTAHKFDIKESEEKKKKVYKPVKDDIRKYLGPGSLITVDFKPNAFFYQTKKTLYSFSPEIETIIIWAYRENSNPDAKRPSMKKHKWIERGEAGFALKVPLGYQGPEMQTAVPVHDVDSFNAENLRISQVLPGERGPIMFASAGDSLGPVYFRGTGVIRYDVKKDPTYGSRNLTFAEEEANQHIHRVTRGAWEKVMEVVTEDSEKIFGEKYDRDVIDELCRPPLYSQNDAERSNPRVNMKFPLEEKSDKPLFDLYVLSHPSEDGEEGTVQKVDMGDSCDEAEMFLTPGTTVQYVAMGRPVIVGTSIYWSYRVAQILVDPEQERVVAPPLSGFAFPGFEEAEVESRSSKIAVAISGDNISFTNPDKNKDGRVFYQTLANYGEHTSPYLVLPECTVAYDIGLVNDPENDEYGYRTRHNLADQDPSDEKLFAALEGGHLKHATETSKDLFGAKKSEPVVKASLGKLIKFSKSDAKKEYPYWTTRTPVYENNHGGVDIAFEAYRLIPSASEDGKAVIQKIDLHQPEDLLKVFYQGARVRLLVTQKTWMVDGRLKPSFSVAQVLLVPPPMDTSIPFVDSSTADMVDLTSAAYNAYREAEEAETKDTEATETTESGDGTAVLDTTETTENIENTEDVTEEVRPTEDVVASKSGSEDERSEDGSGSEESEEEEEEEEEEEGEDD